MNSSTTTTNHLGQPVGFDVPDWVPPEHPEKQTISGRCCRLEPLDASTHACGLYSACALDKEGRNWTYLPYGPHISFEEYNDWLIPLQSSDDPQFYTVVLMETGDPVGVASFLRIQPANGVIEVGHIHFSEKLKRSVAATEAMFLMMKTAFELGYRRYEWKCDALNAPSRAAAERLGFRYEGTFRQALVYKGRNRD
ncbi:MAG: GNAT family protein, partial [Verrucomicrobiota bacterium]